MTLILRLLHICSEARTQVLAEQPSVLRQTEYFAEPSEKLICAGFGSALFSEGFDDADCCDAPAHGGGDPFGLNAQLESATVDAVAGVLYGAIAQGRAADTAITRSARCIKPDTWVWIGIVSMQMVFSRSQQRRAWLRRSAACVTVFTEAFLAEYS